jgi:hypothetical protein
LLFVVVLLVSASAAAYSWRPLPWHLVDLWWLLRGEAEFRELSLEMEISGDPFGGLPMYLAPWGLIEVNGIRLYGGLQTETDLMRGRKAPGIILSRFGTTDLANVKRAPGGIGIRSQSEGTFVSVRNAFDWGAGRYRVTLTGTDDGSGEGKWLAFTVCPLPEGACGNAGALRIPGDGLRLGKGFRSFVEAYGFKGTPEAIPDMAVVFRNPRLDGRPIVPRELRASYPGNVPPFGKATAAGAGAKVETGRPFDHSGLPADAKGTRSERLAQFASH